MYHNGTLTINLGKYKLNAYFTESHIILCIFVIILGGILNFAALALGWQGAPDTLASRAFFVSLMLIFGMTGYMLGRIDID
jgi:hypothetical protein